MRKKIYHIVDPDTGRVVGEKRVGRIGQAFYETPPKERAMFVLLLVPCFLMLSSVVLCILTFSLSNMIPSFSDWAGPVLGVNAVISVLLIFLWQALDERRSKKGSESDTSEEE